MNCKPNQRCLIIGSAKGLEHNIGKQLTTTTLCEPDEGISIPRWNFKDADLDMVGGMTVEAEPVHASVPILIIANTPIGLMAMRTIVVWPDKFLMPLEGDATLETKVKEKELSS